MFATNLCLGDGFCTKDGLELRGQVNGQIVSRLGALLALAASVLCEFFSGHVQHPRHCIRLGA
jgi:hypothetical protein